VGVFLGDSPRKAVYERQYLVALYQQENGRNRGDDAMEHGGEQRAEGAGYDVPNGGYVVAVEVLEEGREHAGYSGQDFLRVDMHVAQEIREVPAIDIVYEVEQPLLV
jgi:hypothetical protein